MQVRFSGKLFTTTFTLALAAAMWAGCATAEKKIKHQEPDEHPVQKGVYHFTCAQHPGGFCQEFATPEGAKAAEAEHRRVTGHTETLTAPGKCP